MIIHVKKGKRINEEAVEPKENEMVYYGCTCNKVYMPN